jgi:repressor LexA
MDQRPTKKQRELLSFIDGFIKGYGYGPSYREIMRALEYKSVSTVATHINGLIERGWLIKKDNSARTLEVMMPNESKSIAEPGTAKAPTITAENEIRGKLEELKKDDLEKNAKEIQTLVDALMILGYETASKKELA